MFSYDQNQGGSNPFGDAPAPAQGPSRGVSYEQQVFRGNPPPSHHKENSIVSNLSFGEVMGGGAPPQSQFAPHEDENEVNVQSTPSMDQINQLKAKAEDADQLARDAENTHLTMVANANELRRIADEAEAIARSKLAEAIEKKKKGIMGGGGKKKKSMVRFGSRVRWDCLCSCRSELRLYCFTLITFTERGNASQGRC